MIFCGVLLRKEVFSSKKSITMMMMIQYFFSQFILVISLDMTRYIYMEWYGIYFILHK